jgi:hypothetical protein
MLGDNTIKHSVHVVLIAGLSWPLRDISSYVGGLRTRYGDCSDLNLTFIKALEGYEWPPIVAVTIQESVMTLEPRLVSSPLVSDNSSRYYILSNAEFRNWR